MLFGSNLVLLIRTFIATVTVLWLLLRMAVDELFWFMIGNGWNTCFRTSMQIFSPKPEVARIVGVQAGLVSEISLFAAKGVVRLFACQSTFREDFWKARNSDTIPGLWLSDFSVCPAVVRSADVSFLTGTTRQVISRINARDRDQMFMFKSLDLFKSLTNL
jgi:hypothetical protein